MKGDNSNKLFYWILPAVHWLLSSVLAGYLFCHLEYNEVYSLKRECWKGER